MDRSQKVILTCMCQISNDDKILILHKVNNSYTGVTFPGGHIEETESLTNAIIREVYEETGLTIKNPVMCGIYDWIQDDGMRYFVFLYRASEFTGELHSSNEGEVEWIKKTDFLSQPLAHGMEAVFEIINSEHVSECFFEIPTMKETIY